MMDRMKIVSSRTLRSSTITKRKSLQNDEEYDFKSSKKNKRATLLSSIETSLDSEDSEIRVSVTKKKTRATTKADIYSGRAAKLYPIFQPLVVKSKEVYKTENLLQIDKDPVIIQELNGHLGMCRKTRKSKFHGAQDAIDKVKKGNVFSFYEKHEKQILRLRKKFSDGEEWTIINGPKVHPMFKRANKNTGKLQKSKDNPVLNVKDREKRCLRSRGRKNKAPILKSEDSINIVKGIRKKYSKKRSGNLKLKSSFTKKSVSVNESLQPKKLHSIFLSAEKTKSAFNKRNVKIKGIAKSKAKKLSHMKLREKISDVVAINSSDDEVEASSGYSTQNCPIKKSLNIEDCVVSNSNCDLRYKMNEFRNEVYFPKISHIKQSCDPLYSELQAINDIALSEDPDHETYFVSSWDGIVGLIDSKCIRYIQSSTSDDFHVCFPDNLSVDDKNQSLPVDSSLEQECMNNKKMHTQDSDLAWNDVVHFDIDKIVANSPVDVVKSWLDAWKLKCLKFSNDYNIDCNESDDSDDDDDQLEKAIIIYGKPGTGKTSIVHLLAQSLNFSVLEVNASSCRTGRHITSRLQEAFHSYGVHNTIFQEIKKAQKDETEENSLRISKLKKHVSEGESKAVIHKRKSKKILKQGVLSFNLNDDKKRNSEHFLSKSKNISSLFANIKETDKMVASNAKLDIITCTSDSVAKTRCPNSDQQFSTLPDKKVSTLILFDDVDVVFDEDDGFWCAVNTFLKTTKRPVVLTVSRHLEIVLNNLNNNYKVINFNDLCDNIDLSRGLNQLCDETYINSVSKTLKSLYANDKRRQLLHMQFWNKPNTVHSNFLIKDCVIDKLVDEMSVNHKVSSINDSFPCQFLDIGKILCSDDFLDISHLFMCHYIGSDVLYSHLFNILSLIDCDELQNSWSSVHGDYLETILFANSSIEKQEVMNGADKPDLLSVAEAESLATLEQCKTPPSILLGVKSLSCVMDDFSVANVLKSQLGFDKFLWLSTNERLKQWSAGLPICTDDTHPVLETTCIDIISTINLLSIRKCVQNLPSSLQTSINKNIHTDHLRNNFFFPIPENNDNSKERCIQRILLVLPLVQQLNMRPIILEYFSFLQTMCRFETEKKKTFQRSRRFLHYFDSLSLNLDPNIFE